MPEETLADIAREIWLESSRSDGSLSQGSFIFSLSFQTIATHYSGCMGQKVPITGFTCMPDTQNQVVSDLVAH